MDDNKKYGKVVNAVLEQFKQVNLVLENRKGYHGVGTDYTFSYEILGQKRIIKFDRLVGCSVPLAYKVALEISKDVKKILLGENYIQFIRASK